MRGVAVFLSSVAIYFFSVFPAVLSAQAASGFAADEVSDEDVAAILTGRWHGVYAYDDGEVYEFLSNRYPDGTYLIEYRSIIDGKIVDEGRERGTWRIEDIEYQSQPTAIEVSGEFRDVRFPRVYRYEILSIEDNVFRYREAMLEMDFEARRVSEDFQLAPLPYAEAFSEESIDVAEPASTDFDGEMRAYLEENGAEFIARFYEVCVTTGAQPDLVTARADGLGWARANEGMKKGKTSWTSFGFGDVEGMQKPPFVLELYEGGEESDDDSSCVLAMWGSSGAPEIAKLEVDIMLDLLEQKMSVGELSVTDKTYYEGRIAEYHTVLQDPANPDLRATYRWMGGVHWLAATSQ